MNKNKLRIWFSRYSRYNNKKPLYGLVLCNCDNCRKLRQKIYYQ